MRWRVYFLHDYGFANTHHIDVWAWTKVRAIRKARAYFEKYGYRIFVVRAVRRILWFTK